MNWGMVVLQTTALPLGYGTEGLSISTVAAGRERVLPRSHPPSLPGSPLCGESSSTNSEIRRAGQCPHDTRSFTLCMTASSPMAGDHSAPRTVWHDLLWHGGLCRHRAVRDRVPMICNAHQKPRTHVHRDRRVSPRTSLRARDSGVDCPKHPGRELQVLDASFLFRPIGSRRRSTPRGASFGAAFAASFLISPLSTVRR